MSLKPDDISRTQPLKPIGEEGQTAGAPPGQSFESYMQQAAQKKNLSTQAPSPFELASAQTPQTPLAGGPTYESMFTQIKSTQGMLGDIGNNLNTPNLKLKQSQRYLLRNKLNDANTYLRAANAKMGAPAIEPPPPSTSGGIIGKFIDYVNEGQMNVLSAQQQLLSLKDKGSTLQPGDFLAIQIKLGHAQQEVESASIMLSKAVDDLKQLFNIQI